MCLMRKRRRQESDEPGNSQQSSQNMHEPTDQRQCTINHGTIQSTRRLGSLMGSFGKSFFKVKHGLIKYNLYKLLQETSHLQATQHTSGVVCSAKEELVYMRRCVKFPWRVAWRRGVVCESLWFLFPKANSSSGCPLQRSNL